MATWPGTAIPRAASAISGAVQPQGTQRERRGRLGRPGLVSPLLTCSAQSIAVHCLLFTTCTDAPWRRSSSTTKTRFSITASCSAVLPLLLQALMEAPCCKKTQRGHTEGRTTVTQTPGDVKPAAGRDRQLTCNSSAATSWWPLEQA